MLLLMTQEALSGPFKRWHEAASCMEAVLLRESGSGATWE
jgi:hypothetical protein